MPSSQSRLKEFRKVEHAFGKNETKTKSGQGNLFCLALTTAQITHGNLRFTTFSESGSPFCSLSNWTIVCGGIVIFLKSRDVACRCVPVGTPVSVCGEGGHAVVGTRSHRCGVRSQRLFH